jgi:hypothetical protein
LISVGQLGFEEPAKHPFGLDRVESSNEKPRTTFQLRLSWWIGAAQKRIE